MDITKADYLPNELWLEVFSYLENADLFYTFNVLNKHFRKQIEGEGSFLHCLLSIEINSLFIFALHN